MTLVFVTNVLAWSAQVTFIAAVCAPLPRLLRLPGHVQYGFWRIVLAASLALPLLQPRHIAIATVMTTALGPAAPAGPTLVLHPHGGAARVNWPEWALIALAAGAVLRMGWMVLGSFMLRRMRTLGDPVGEDTAADVTDLASRIGARAAVRWIPRLRQPATFGFRRPMVLLPETHRPRTVARPAPRRVDGAR
jgi:beta-lactamase regulating signal transducer with metallopeptidase domain